jgi:hypothetical protein
MPTATKTKIRTVRLARTDGGLALVIREQAEGGPLKVDAYCAGRAAAAPAPGGVTGRPASRAGTWTP